MDEGSTGGHVRYVVLNWLPPELVDEWNEWHNSVHVPELLATPYIRGARKYRVEENSFATSWQPQYATVYELDSMDDMRAYLDGPAAALREEYNRRYGATGKIARLILTETERWESPKPEV